MIGLLKSMDTSDKLMFASALGSILIWWVIVGRKKYGTKGMSRYV